MDIKKICKSIKSAAYYDIDFNLGDEKTVALAKFISGRNIEVLRMGFDLYLLDVEFLSHRINLDCSSCEKYNTGGCCSGAPWKFSKKNKANLDVHAVDVLSIVSDLEPEQFNYFLTNGGFVSKTGLINSTKDRCAFLVNDNGWDKCAIHKYALESGVDKYSICPLSCLMFPLDIITLKLKSGITAYYITSVVDNDYWREFGRWEDYSLNPQFVLKCLDSKCHGKREFCESDYRPVYVVNRDLLIHEFGVGFYKKMEGVLSCEKRS